MLPVAPPESYCGPAPVPAGWLGQWNLDPLVIAVLGGAALLAAVRPPADPARARALHGALALMAALYVSPLCALGAALFSARVAHHVALATLVAPLLAIALGDAVRRLPGSLTAWTAGHAVLLWVWHAPALYGAAVTQDALYWIMQATIAGSATVFWSRLMQAPAAGAVAALLLSMVQMGLLGALITFAPGPMYLPHLVTTAAWGLTPLEDQQIAGLIMWAPAAGIYLLAAMAFGARMLRPAPAR